MTDPLSNSLLSELSLFYGQLTPQSAHVYAALPSRGKAGRQLRGQLRGPRNQLTRTLPATVPLQPLEAPDRLVAGAVLPDPCFWSPGFPYLYDVQVELVENGQVREVMSRSVGLRHFGAHASQLFLDAQPWQLLGASRESVVQPGWAAWRETGLVRLVTRPTSAECLEATDQGVMLIADVDDNHCCDEQALGQELLRLSQHGAVAIAVVPRSVEVTAAARQRVPNLLLARHYAADHPCLAAQDADVIICDLADMNACCPPDAPCDVPVLLRCGGGPYPGPAEAAEALRHHITQRTWPPSVAGFLAGNAGKF